MANNKYVTLQQKKKAFDLEYKKMIGGKLTQAQNKFVKDTNKSFDKLNKEMKDYLHITTEKLEKKLLTSFIN